MRRFVSLPSSPSLCCCSCRPLPGPRQPPTKPSPTPVAAPAWASCASTWADLAEVTDPTVSAIDPASARDDSDTSVTITGTGFVDTPTVTLGTTALTNVTFVDSTQP